MEGGLKKNRTSTKPRLRDADGIQATDFDSYNIIENTGKFHRKTYSNKLVPRQSVRLLFIISYQHVRHDGS